VHTNHKENIEAVTKISLQFLAEVIGQCPAGLESSSNRGIVFAVLGFQYGAVQSAAFVAGLDENTTACIAIKCRQQNQRNREGRCIENNCPDAGSCRKRVSPDRYRQQSHYRFFNSATEEEKLAKAKSLQEILRQIDKA